MYLQVRLHEFILATPQQESRGRRGIRTLGPFRINRVAGGCHRPLGHPSMKETVGFGPTDPFGSLILKTSAINHSATSPWRREGESNSHGCYTTRVPTGTLTIRATSPWRRRGDLNSRAFRPSGFGPDAINHSATPPQSDRVGSNHRSPGYQPGALPLSYDPSRSSRSPVACQGIEPRLAVCRTAVLPSHPQADDHNSFALRHSSHLSTGW